MTKKFQYKPGAFVALSSDLQYGCQHNHTTPDEAQRCLERLKRQGPAKWSNGIIAKIREKERALTTGIININLEDLKG